MGKFWTVGMIWGLLAWLPFHLDLPFALQATFGLPVLLAGYLTVFLESFIGSIPDSLSFCFSLPTGIALSWGIQKVLPGSKHRRLKELRREVDSCSGRR